MIVAVAEIRRTAKTALAIAVLLCLLSACGGSQGTRARGARTMASERVAYSRHPPKVLSLSGLGTFAGRCPRGAHTWLLRFVPSAAASETVSYRVGDGPRHTIEASPGKAITVRLVPDATRTHEPADRFVPPPGQPRGRTKATSVSTTAPLRVVIYQATEPQTLQADIRLALAALGGESRRCALVGSTVHAFTYPN